MTEQRENRTLQDYVAVLRRLLALLGVPAAAIVFSRRQEALYSASAEVFMPHQDLAAVLTTTQSNLQTLPDREAATQADVAHTPRVAKEVLAALKLTVRTVDRSARLDDYSRLELWRGGNLRTESSRSRDRGHASEVALLAQLARGEEPAPDPAGYLTAMRVTFAALESLATGAEVRLNG